jgi:hypothetical protein
MTQYILLTQNNLKSDSSPQEWEVFFTAVQQSGLFKGGSEIGSRIIVGDTQTARSTDHIVGYMRFDSDDKQKILDLLAKHPVVIHGGTVELCELPKS